MHHHFCEGIKGIYVPCSHKFKPAARARLSLWLIVALKKEHGDSTMTRCPPTARSYYCKNVKKYFSVRHSVLNSTSEFISIGQTETDFTVNLDFRSYPFKSIMSLDHAIHSHVADSSCYNRKSLITYSCIQLVQYPYFETLGNRPLYLQLLS